MRRTPDRQDWYAVLEVSPEASAEVISAAHRVLSKRYHPDVPGGDLDQMKAVNLARDVLLDPRLRREFDRSLAARGATAPAAAAGQGGGFRVSPEDWMPTAPSPDWSASVPRTTVTPVPDSGTPVPEKAASMSLRERAEMVLGGVVLAGRILIFVVLAYAALELVAGVVWLIWTLATR